MDVDPYHTHPEKHCFMVLPDLMPFAVQQACPAIQSSMNRAINFFTSLRLAELAVGDASLCPLGQELQSISFCNLQASVWCFSIVEGAAQKRELPELGRCDMLSEIKALKPVKPSLVRDFCLH